MNEAQEAISRWENYAEEFTGRFLNPLGDLSRIEILNPALLNLLGDVKGKVILDAGCGDGYFSRILAQQGAVVTGVDFALKMLELAKTRTPSELNINYCHENFAAMSLDTATFDVVVSNMVIMDLPDYQAAFAEAYRVLKGGGEFIFSILHPCFITPTSGWVKDENGQKQYWMVDKYFAEGRYEQEDFGNVFGYHRTLTSYITTILKTGFTIEALIEPLAYTENLQNDTNIQDDLRRPNFVIFKLKKPL